MRRGRLDASRASSPAASAPQRPLRGGDQALEIDAAGGRQDDVARAVAAVGNSRASPRPAERRRSRRCPARCGPADAGRNRRARHFSSAPNGGWSSYIWISSRITFFSVSKSSSRSEGRRMSASSSTAAVLVLRQHGRVEDGVFLVGEGVVVGPHLVELAVHVVGRAAGRALEHHVFEEMAHAGHCVGLVAGAGLDEKAQGRRMGLGVALGDDLQAVGQIRGSRNLHTGTSKAAASRA